MVKSPAISEVNNYLVEELDISHIVTEDDTPVDSIFSEKQQRLLTDTLYASWECPAENRAFVALANVGLFYGLRFPPLVPDMMLSLGVSFPEDILIKKNRSYFLWEYGKPPDVVVEIVSNREGGEMGKKMRKYADIGIWYYIIYDPLDELGIGILRFYQLGDVGYRSMETGWLPKVGLGLKLWHGEYEGTEGAWLRWYDADGNWLLTGAERAKKAETLSYQAQQEAKQAQEEAKQAQQEALQEREAKERLMAQLQALGITPDL